MRRKSAIRSTVSLVAILLGGCAIAADVTGISITDGDTVGVVDVDNRYFKVRLNGIDSPENKQPQPYSMKGRDLLAEKLYGKLVTLNEHGKDGYARVIGTILIEGRNISREVRPVQQGRVAPRCREHRQGEEAGLWGDPMPVAPREYRTTAKQTTARAKIAAKNSRSSHRVRAGPQILGAGSLPDDSPRIDRVRSNGEASVGTKFSTAYILEIWDRPCPSRLSLYCSLH